LKLVVNNKQKLKGMVIGLIINKEVTVGEIENMTFSLIIYFSILLVDKTK